MRASARAALLSKILVDDVKPLTEHVRLLKQPLVAFFNRRAVNIIYPYYQSVYAVCTAKHMLSLFNEENSPLMSSAVLDPHTGGTSVPTAAVFSKIVQRLCCIAASRTMS